MPLNLDVTPNVGNHFAWMRTHLALQRTLMAVVRTAVSLIGFGFTVAQFFQKLVSAEATGRLGPDAPRNLGLTLIAAGVISLALSTYQYRQVQKYLTGEDFKAIAGGGAKSLHASTYFVAFVVMAVGVVAFFSVFMRF